MLSERPLQIRAFAATAARARSLRSAWLLHTSRPGLASVRLPRFAEPFRFRKGTSDAYLLRNLLYVDLPDEYSVTLDPAPRVILDVGANIGAVTAAFVRRWPQATIYAFEPLPDNFALLQHNLAQFPNVTAVNYGLGARTARRAYVCSDDPQNFGGGGFTVDDKSAPAFELPVKAVGEALCELRLSHVDLIKIDTEGSEHEIITSIPAEVLATVRCIVGELHGKPRDQELLDRLRSDFAVEAVVHRGRVRHFKALRKPR